VSSKRGIQTGYQATAIQCSPGQRGRATKLKGREIGKRGHKRWFGGRTDQASSLEREEGLMRFAA
jgi:hypothetical protein